MMDDTAEFEAVVAALEATAEDRWIAVWEAAAKQHEEAGDAHEAVGDFAAARKLCLQAKTYYAIGRSHGEITPAEAGISEDRARAHRAAGRQLSGEGAGGCGNRRPSGHQVVQPLRRMKPGRIG